MTNNAQTCTATYWPLFSKGEPTICGRPTRQAFATTTNYRCCTLGHVTASESD